MSFGKLRNERAVLSEKKKNVIELLLSCPVTSTFRRRRAHTVYVNEVRVFSPAYLSI